MEVLRLAWVCDPEDAFLALFSLSEAAFWLDSAVVVEGGSRFSFMGDGPVVRPSERARGALEGLEAALAARGADVAPAGLPFAFKGGLVGYLGYELKAETEGARAHESPYLDAQFILAERLIAFDHVERAIWLVQLDDGEWIESTAQRLCDAPRASPPEGQSDVPAEFVPDLSAAAYRQAIEACQRELAAGESYEICLTTQFRSKAELDALNLYRVLRRLSPAPYAAFLRFGELAIVSSSPECFLRLGDDGWLESKPIKGTAARLPEPEDDRDQAERLRTDSKTRAENMMIVDLVRNDLGRVCEVGSVEVAELMAVESYASVHQLVTTVRGRLRADCSAIDAVRACFPPGSMTGAPKIRTMEIIDRLEPAARGIYSGCLGWFSFSGACDLSVAIRTLVVNGDRLSYGTGGAITVDSDPELELAEIGLKAADLRRALAAVVESPA